MANFILSVFSFLQLIFLFYVGHFFCGVDGKVPAVIVFGDSSVDTGNNNGIETILKSNFEPYGRDFEGGRPTGRFSNGRVPVDFFSEFYGLKKTVPAYLDPDYGMEDFVTGVNFASAGTGYDNTTSAVLVSLYFFFFFFLSPYIIMSIVISVLVSRNCKCLIKYIEI
ncbi:hypothetical protein RDABS01_022208 [Bienertia sinuspersici]